jgi:hypothetical protein
MSIPLPSLGVVAEPFTNFTRNLLALRTICAERPEIEPKTMFQTDFFFDTMRPMERGWLLPFLLMTDDAIWGRWDHWARTRLNGRMLDEAIPKIEWAGEGRNGCRKHVEHCLNNVTRHGHWQGWSSWQYMDYFLDWLLFGFGHLTTMPDEPLGCEGAAKRLYQVFTLERLQAWPHDYFGEIMAENQHGRHLGFYPTPMNVVEMMTRMNFSDGGDMRDKTVMDPCLGTGRMLLCASNYSYRLYGVDINPSVIKAALVNAYIYAPWMAKPFPFWDEPGETLLQKAA